MDKLRFQRSYFAKMRFGLPLPGQIILFFLMVFGYTSCQKPKLEEIKPKEELKTMNGSAELQIDVTDIVAKLPKTILHNLGTRAKIYADRAEWQYTDYGLIMRIPTSSGGNRFVYASKSYAAPSRTNVYLVEFTPTSASASSNLSITTTSSAPSFSGKQIWIDLQDWKAYGIQYQNNQPISYLQPMTLVTVPNWEERTLAHGHYLLDGSGNIVVNPGPPLVLMDGDPNDQLGCWEDGGWWSNLFAGLGNLIDGIGEWFGGIFDGNGNGGNPPGGGGGGGGGGGNWGGGGPGGPPGGYGGGNSNPGGNPGGPNGDGYGGGGWPGGGGGNPDPGGPPLVINGNSVGSGSAIALTEVPDANGNLPSRIVQLQIFLQSKPDGMMDCNELAGLPMQTYQEVGSYQVPQSVIDRINWIRDQNAPAYTTSNFRIQHIQNALGGVVNCDYFYVKINSLPYLNGIQMTADQLLEYFRTHKNDFIGTNINVSFGPYIDYVAGSVNINETSIWGAPYENSQGALVHLDMLDDGTVVESGYSRTSTHNNYTVTTMKSPLDFEHPVAGNRRWGIFASGGAYYFYIMGVDRTHDMSTTLANWAFNAAFGAADELWRSVIDGMIAFCDTHQGDALFREEKIVRPKWNTVKQFLQGQITLQQLKAALNCP